MKVSILKYYKKIRDWFLPPGTRRRQWSVNLKEKILYRMRKAEEYNRPLMEHLIVETIGQCNLACIMCPIQTYKVPGKAVMTQETFAKIIPYFRQVAVVDMTGWGEPLLDKDLFKRIEIIKGSGCQVGLTSNGTLLSEEKSEILLALGLKWIGFSFDGGSKETYESIRLRADYEQVLSNIKKLASKKKALNSDLHITATFVAMKFNKHELMGFIAMMEEIGVDEVYVKPLDVVWALENKKLILGSSELSSLLKKVFKRKWRVKISPLNIPYYERPRNDCGALATRSAFITWDGFVAPCCNLGHPVPRIKFGLFRDSIIADTQYVLGNIHEEPLQVIWNKPEYIRFRRQLFRGDVPSPCRGCNLL